MCSSNYQPSSIFICNLQYDFENNENHNKCHHNTGTYSRKQKHQHELIVCHILSGQHEQPITSFDWSVSANNKHRHAGDENEDERCSSQSSSHSGCNSGANDGHIVTCGEDSRVFVWTFHSNFNGTDTPLSVSSSMSSSASWIATQVLLQQSVCLTPLDCQWDTSGENFALGMGGNHRTASVEICYYENDDVGWTSQQIGRRKIKSSVLCVAWYPRNRKRNNKIDLIACGGCDYRCRMFCTEKSSKGDRRINFGDQCAEFNTNGKGWVISVAWSSSGNHLAFTSQKSCVFIVDCTCLQESSSASYESLFQNTVPIVVNMIEYLPIRSILFLNEDNIAMGGYDGSFATLEHRGEKRWEVQVDSELCNGLKMMGLSKENKHDSSKSSIICMNMILSKQKTRQETNCSIIVSGSEGLFDIW